MFRRIWHWLTDWQKDPVQARASFMSCSFFLWFVVLLIGVAVANVLLRFAFH